MTATLDQPQVFADPASVVREYMDGVLDGTVPAARLVIAAVKRQVHDLEHAEERGLWFDEEAAARVIRFFGFLRHWKGEWGPKNGLPGEVIRPEPWQAFILWVLFGWKRADGTRRFRQGYIEVPRKNGKALAIDTPIPTPTGWVAMGDLKVGDVVFDERGQQCCVTFATDMMHGRDCYQVKFSDGTSVVADAEHLWLTDARTDRDRLKGRGGKNAGPKPIAKTTVDIRRTLLVSRPSHLRSGIPEYNHRIPVADAIECEDREFPIDPYVLGAWLGDGHSACNRLTFDGAEDELVSHLRDAGVCLGVWNRDRRSNAVTATISPVGHRSAKGRANPLRSALRDLNLLNNKHIPAAYLRGSVRQRTAMIQGLMDTDGYCGKSGQCEFTTTSVALRDGFLELARSLGFKPVIKTARATIYGEDCGEKFRIIFHAYADRPVFRLRRKTTRQKPRPAMVARSSFRQIVAVNPIESVPVRCIQVDSPSRLYLAGEGMVPTHNTTLISGVGLYLLMGDGEPGAEVYSFATKKEQSRIVMTDAAAFVGASTSLKSRLHVSGGKYVNNIAYMKAASKWEPLGADSKTQDGLNVHGGIGDELHEHRDNGMWSVIETATGARRQPMIIGITTAGSDPDSFCGTMHEYAEKLLNDFDKEDGVRNDSFFALISAAEKDDDWADPEVWRKANPNYGVSVKPDDLADKCLKAQSIPSERNKFLRKHLNIWTDQVEAWIPVETWDLCKDPTFDVSRLKGRKCFGGLDLSSKLDLTAFVLMFPPTEEDPKWRVLAFFWIPEASAAERERLDRIPYAEWTTRGLVVQTPGNVTDYDIVEARIVELCGEYAVEDVAFDPWQCVSTSNRLQDHHGIKMVEFRQGMISMNEPCKEFERLIVSGGLAHDGNAVMRWMMGNAAVKRDEAGNMRPIKPENQHRKKIDGVVAAIMGLGRGITGEPASTFTFAIV
jgi:phage terminase large subunit-like protein